MANYIRVNDIVRVKTYEELAQKHPVVARNSIFIQEDGEYFTEQMKEIGGMEFMVQEIVVMPMRERLVTVIGNINGWIITPSMIDVIDPYLGDEE